MVDWEIDFLLNQIELYLGKKNRQFLADLVLYEWVAETNFKFSLKIEKESLFKQYFIKYNFQHLLYQQTSKCYHF